jgi:hypothetical protein
LWSFRTIIEATIQNKKQKPVTYLMML